jgi:hypothetical protein
MAKRLHKIHAMHARRLRVKARRECTLLNLLQKTTNPEKFRKLAIDLFKADKETSNAVREVHYDLQEIWGGKS